LSSLPVQPERSPAAEFAPSADASPSADAAPPPAGPPAVIAAPAGEAPSVTESRRVLGTRILSRAARVLRSSVVLGMFIGALGVYPAQATVPEPAAAREVVDVIVANDAVTLSRMLDQKSLEALSKALSTIGSAPQPLVEITDVRYLGSVGLDEGTVVSYLARGRDPGGMNWVVGFALRVEGGQVVGVN